MVTNSLYLENPMTVEEFLNFDNGAQANEEISEHWEDELTTEDDNEDFDLEPQEQEPVLKLKTHNAT